SYAYHVFRDIMISEPPVLDVSPNTNKVARARYSIAVRMQNRFIENDNDDDDDDQNGSFMDDLTDSLHLTAGIFKDILPLINVHDYEQPLMQLMGTLVDSNMIKANDYEPYQTKFLIEA